MAVVEVVDDAGAAALLTVVVGAEMSPSSATGVAHADALMSALAMASRPQPRRVASKAAIM